MNTLTRSAMELGKLVVGGLAFVVGMLLGSIAASLAGLRAPALPMGTDQAALSALMAPVSLLRA